MQITTKFNVGDKAWTVDTKKMTIVDFTVGKITVVADGGEPSATINPINKDGKLDYYTTYFDKNCFESKDALMAQLYGKTLENPKA